jgi:hypothetical protein
VAVKPGRGGTTPMLPATASVMTQAISSPRSAKTRSSASVSLYGRTRVSPAVAAGTPGESGRPNVATPEPAEASRLSTCPW